MTRRAMLSKIAGLRLTLSSALVVCSQTVEALEGGQGSAAAYDIPNLLYQLENKVARSGVMVAELRSLYGAVQEVEAGQLELPLEEG